MSKAFTKEGDDAPEVAPRRRGVPVPDLNMVTPDGLRAARDELAALVREGGDADRIRELGDHLATAQPVEPPADRGEVGLGATVMVEAGDGRRQAYRIVGAIEADARRGWVAWQSPIAQALWGHRAGDSAQLPRGEVEVIDVRY